ncbi:hypothetical protein PJ985_12900 [Streptomyces sp. ACA25]|uniref:hypothetical protein n=1 Tax=Streptomyces sp. ACA25 TaxID=3022596 RepID=UPI00230711D5|nr:hypothetical protein [Streptomyces sp. ACA25]MDB1088464.1 hypothetical protein [Streptomyces sp. ACA25]
MSGDDRPTVPPVRLPSDAELARDALAAPLLSRAVRLARWAEPGVPVGAGGELLTAGLREAVGRLGLDAGRDGAAFTAEAWNFAVDTGLVEIEETGEPGAASGAETARPEGESEAAIGTAAPGEELTRLTAGAPDDVLEVWLGGLDAVLSDASTPSFEELIGDLDGALGADGRIDPAAIDLGALDWDPDQESDFLDGALSNLYLLAATDETVAAGAMVPLPVVAASMVVPEDMDEPSDSVLEEVSATMMKLDGQFRVLADTGALDYHPVDDALILDEQDGDPGPGVTEDEDEDLTRYGQVRLTPLGLYGVRQRMLDAGLEAPAVGDLSEEDAGTLLGVLGRHPETAARAEAEQWLDGRDQLAAARDLLAAARGTDPEGPARRLSCQLVMSLIGGGAEPAVREVLDDSELGGLARVWLSERGASEVPLPSEDMIFWLTIDTLAAQLSLFAGEEDPVELRELVQGLVDQHSGFFDRARRTDHPAVVEVLESMGRLHPDKQVAKEARRAAFKARART